MVRRPLSEAVAMSFIVVRSTPLEAKSCRATSSSRSRVLVAIAVICQYNSRCKGKKKTWAFISRCLDF